MLPARGAPPGAVAARRALGVRDLFGPSRGGELWALLLSKLPGSFGSKVSLCATNLVGNRGYNLDSWGGSPYVL